MSELTALYYRRPHGHTETLVMRNVYDEDRDWFLAQGIQLSIEELLTGDFVIYGRFDQEDNEALEMDLGRSCQDTLKALRAQIEHHPEFKPK